MGRKVRKKERKTNGLAVEFDGSLYPVSGLRQAMKDYTSLARFHVTRKGKKLVVHALPTGAVSAEEFRGEFCNYVLYKARGDHD